MDFELRIFTEMHINIDASPKNSIGNTNISKTKLGYIRDIYLFIVVSINNVFGCRKHSLNFLLEIDLELI